MSIGASKRNLAVSAARLARAAVMTVTLLAISPILAAQPTFGNGKGVNLSGAVYAKRPRPDAPAEYQLQPDRWSQMVLLRARGAGFGLVRMVTTPAPLMSDDPTARARGVAWVSRLVDQASEQGFAVIVDMHLWSTDNPATADNVVPDSAALARLTRGEAELAAALALKEKANVSLELLNEPPCAGNIWEPAQLALYRAVRKAAPTLPLILTACRGLYTMLPRVDPSAYRNDRNTYWTFHYYDPNGFTNQESAKLVGVPFPPDPALARSPRAMQSMLPLATAVARPRTVFELRRYLLENRGQATIRADMAGIAGWARRYRISPGRILLGEFGNDITRNNPAAATLRDDELRWLSAMRIEAERAGFAWCHWNMTGDRTIDYDPRTRFYDARALTALGLAGTGSPDRPD